MRLLARIRSPRVAAAALLIALPLGCGGGGGAAAVPASLPSAPDDPSDLGAGTTMPTSASTSPFPKAPLLGVGGSSVSTTPPIAPTGPAGPSTPNVPVLAVANGAPVVPDGTRVMPMGDSITAGFGGVGGYRYFLWSMLLSAGITPDFVGSLTVASPVFMPDPDHEGHSGWRVRDFADHASTKPGDPASTIETILAQHKPTVVLLHAGTNDLWSKHDWQVAPDDLDLLLDRIHAYDERILTVVAKIVPTIVDPVNLSVVWMNTRFHEVTYQAWLDGQNVQVVDMQAACPVLTTVDGVHPDPLCYFDMAEAWLAGMLTVDQPMVPPPSPSPVVAGATATASSEEPGCGPQFAVDGAGLVGTLHTDDEGAPTYWRSAPFEQVVVGPDILGPSGAPPTFTLELPAPHDIDRLDLWNGRSIAIGGGADWLHFESIRRVRVETSPDGSTWSDRGELGLTEGPPRDLSPAEAIAVDWPGTLAIRLTVLETYGKLAGGQTTLTAPVTLSEVQVRGTASP